MSDPVSVLSPFSGDATRIAMLSWTLFIGAAIILVLVGGALWLAMSRRGNARRLLASPRSIMLLGIVFPVVTLTILLNATLLLMRGSEAAGQADIDMTAEQYWWRISHGDGFSTANELRLPVGRPTTLKLLSNDVIHSFWVPSLGGKVDMFPGRPTAITLAPERPGVWRGVCAEFCGTGHAFMAFSVIAMPQTDYDAWRRHESSPAIPPSTPEARRGQELFTNAGCSACHAVRGTTATGAVGPDLTHVGSRASIGAGTLAMTADNLAAFIAASDRHKPGNPMPPFRTLNGDELQAIAAYLMGLK